MANGGIEIIGNLAGITNGIGALPQQIEDNMHNRANEIGGTLKGMVQEKTPILTGGLLQDITYEVGSGKDIVTIYPDTQGQEAMWGRVYVQYQEGPPMGENTYTNPPRLMFQETADTDGYAAVVVWATEVVNTTTDQLIP